MSNYRYSEYKKQEVRWEKISEWWAENKSVRKRKERHCAFSVYSETDDIAYRNGVGLEVVAQKGRGIKENQRSVD